MATGEAMKTKTKDFFELTKNRKPTTGQVIRSFRTNFNFTPKEMGVLTGIAETNLSAIENDRVEIGPRRAARIAAVFGIDPSVLLFPSGLEDPELKDIAKASARLIERKRAG